MFRALTAPALMVLVSVLATPSVAAGEPPPSEARSIRARLQTSEPPRSGIADSLSPVGGAAPSRRGSYVGTLEPAGLDTVAIRVGPSRVLLPVDRITRFEVSRGRSSRFGKGVLIGGAIGAGGGALGSIGQKGPWAGPGLAAVFGGITGMLIGGVVGAIARYERWEELSLESLRSPIVPPDSLPARDAPPQPAPALAADRRPLAGEMVRVHSTVRGLEPVSGWLQTWSERAVTLQRAGSVDSIPRPTILAVEVRRGSRGNGILGTVIGFGCGFLAGVIIHQVTYDGTIAEMGIGWGIIGMPLGAGVGSLIRTGVWEPVPLADPTAVAPGGDRPESPPER